MVHRRRYCSSFRTRHPRKTWWYVPALCKHLRCNALPHTQASSTQVVIERDYLLAGVRGQQPVVKVGASGRFIFLSRPVYSVLPHARVLILERPGSALRKRRCRKLGMATRASNLAHLRAGAHDVDDIHHLDAIVVCDRVRPGDIKQFCGFPRECADVGHGGGGDGVAWVSFAGVVWGRTLWIGVSTQIRDGCIRCGVPGDAATCVIVLFVVGVVAVAFGQVVDPAFGKRTVDHMAIAHCGSCAAGTFSLCNCTRCFGYGSGGQV